MDTDHSGLTGVWLEPPGFLVQEPDVGRPEEEVEEAQHNRYIPA